MSQKFDILSDIYDRILPGPRGHRFRLTTPIPVEIVYSAFEKSVCPERSQQFNDRSFAVETVWSYMSPPDAVAAPQASQPQRYRRKATLFCPDCGHESPVDGDWDYRTRTAPAVEEVRCPTCRTRISERPLPDHAERGVQSVVGRSRQQTPGDTLVTLTRLWSETVTNWLNWPARSQC